MSIIGEIRTSDDVKKSGLFETSNFATIIGASQQILNANPELVSRGMDIGDTPISPMVIDDDYMPIFFTSEVMASYKGLVEMINNPETAKEYSFLLFGKHGTFMGQECYLVDKIVDCSSHEEDLSDRVTKVDKKKFTGGLSSAIQGGYDFVSIGHTHPNIPIEERATTIASFLSGEDKKGGYIREAGLNLSLQDIISYENFSQDVAKYNPNIRTAQTVIMYNGEMAMISKKGDSLARSVILMDATTGEVIYVSSKEELDKKNNQSL